MRPALRPAVALSAATLLLGPVLGVARAAGPAPVPEATPVHLTVVLRSSDPAALESLARAGHVPAANRRAALRSLRPSAAARSRVLTRLRQLGFALESGGDAWDIHVVGTARTARSAFGVALVSSRRGIRPAVEPRTPPSLAGDVLAVVGFDTTPRWRAHVIPDGLAPKDLRQAYSITPALAAGTGDGRTVATVQFSGWHKSDLTTYAAGAGIPDPVGTGRYVPIALDSVNPDTPDGGGGDGEVALDQEAILASAPSATQRAYFGPNSDQGAIDVWGRIAAEVDTQAIDVVSTSWGLCEAVETSSARSAIDQKLSLISAAGATIFAASGDAGRFDCADPGDPTSDFDALAVDYPASNPIVVATGGTYLYRGQTGGFAEDAWEDTLSADGSYHGDGSGGGNSTKYDRPAYQTGGDEVPANLGLGRLVPDIAAVADPYGATGGVYLHDGGWTYAGGTSYAAPLMAGGLAATLASISTPQVGDIHQTLYTKTNRRAFRDVVTGGGSVTFAAHPDYDRVTGLGTPQWAAVGQVLKAQPSIWLRPTTSVRTVPVSVTLPSGVTVARVLVGDNVDCSTPGGSTAVPTSTTLSSGADRTAIVRLVVHDTLNNCLTASAPVVIDTVNPTVGAYLAPATPPQQNVLNARWGFADAAPSSGLDVLLVDIYRYGVSDPVYSFETRKRGFVFGGQEGSQWRVDATGVDTAGNLSPLKWARFSVPWDDKSFTRTGSWSRSANASDYAGSQLVSASKGATATRVVSGRYFHALITRHPQGGYADVYVDGHKTTSPINFYSATVQHTVYVNIANYSTPGFHTVKFVVRGAHPSGSGGNYVFLDGLRATK